MKQLRFYSVFISMVGKDATIAQELMHGQNNINARYLTYYLRYYRVLLSPLQYLSVQTNTVVDFCFVHHGFVVLCA